MDGTSKKGQADQFQYRADLFGSREKMRDMKNYIKQFGIVAVTTLLLVGCAAPVAPTPPPATNTPIAATPVVTEPAPTEEVVTPDANAPVSTTITETQTITPVETLPTEPITSTEGSVEGGSPMVENIEIRILESFPVQVHAVVSGYLPDGCTTIANAGVVNEGMTFQIQLSTQRPADAICTMALVEFEEVIPLDTIDLPAGTYEVVAGDLAVNFDLP